jgi:hypothetical protein
MIDCFNDNPDVMLVQSDSVFIDPKDKVISYVANKDADAELTYFGWRHFGMYRREVMNKISGYNDKLKNACEDGDLFMQIADKFRFIHIGVVLYQHRHHGKNQSHKNEKCHDCNERSICNYIRIWAKHAKVNHLTMEPIKEAA